MLSPSSNREKRSLDDRSIAAIEDALEKGYRVEISPDRDGNIKLRTVHRKDIKVDTVPTA